jgi:hypothetical protein
MEIMAHTGGGLPLLGLIDRKNSKPKEKESKNLLNLKKIGASPLKSALKDKNKKIEDGADTKRSEVSFRGLFSKK